MVNTSETVTRTNISYADECPYLTDEDEEARNSRYSKSEQYNWDARTQGLIMSSFFYAYFVTVLTGGYIAKKFGAKRVFGGGVFLTSVLTLLTPAAVRWGTIPFIVARALEGIGEDFDVPWKKILTSVPMLGLLIGHIGIVFGLIILMTEIPNYLNAVLHFGVEASGFVTGLPNILEAFGGVCASYFADKMISSKRFSVTVVRKIFNSIAMYGSGLFMLGITASGCNLTLIIVLYSLLLYVNGFKYSGYNVTHVDMCPPLAGILFGLTNGIASLTGIIAPNMVGAFTASGGTRTNWNKVFYVTAGIYFIASTIFNLLVSAELQDWNTKKVSEEKSKTAETKS
ncbi:sialin [Trichonephila inaurata madagascariensis]|uniref:Sialin n=1 Tax=Trichonephila inaurata madagascariensis TaxID=2747483 RepID=A0A8X6YXX8_9ARAC|nr:sialin [Trichonephila inaurata madagascariensis]